jgi:hypothetical protein
MKLEMRFLTFQVLPPVALTPQLCYMAYEVLKCTDVSVVSRIEICGCLANEIRMDFGRELPTTVPIYKW